MQAGVRHPIVLACPHIKTNTAFLAADFRSRWASQQIRNPWIARIPVGYDAVLVGVTDGETHKVFSIARYSLSWQDSGPPQPGSKRTNTRPSLPNESSAARMLLTTEDISEAGGHDGHCFFAASKNRISKTTLNNAEQFATGCDDKFLDTCRQPHPPRRLIPQTGVKQNCAIGPLPAILVESKLLWLFLKWIRTTEQPVWD
jgi:hypothetical protein